MMFYHKTLGIFDVFFHQQQTQGDDMIQDMDGWPVWSLGLCWIVWAQNKGTLGTFQIFQMDIFYSWHPNQFRIDAQKYGGFRKNVGIAPVIRFF